MGVIVIRCPKSGEEISTDIEIEPEGLLRLPPVTSETVCPLCGEVHAWRPRQARVAELPIEKICVARAAMAKSGNDSPDESTPLEGA